MKNTTNIRSVGTKNVVLLTSSSESSLLSETVALDFTLLDILISTLLKVLKSSSLRPLQEQPERATERAKGLGNHVFLLGWGLEVGGPG